MTTITTEQFARVTGWSIEDRGPSPGMLDIGDLIRNQHGSVVSYETAVERYFTANAGASRAPCVKEAAECARFDVRRAVHGPAAEDLFMRLSALPIDKSRPGLDVITLKGEHIALKVARVHGEHAKNASCTSGQTFVAILMTETSQIKDGALSISIADQELGKALLARNKVVERRDAWSGNRRSATTTFSIATPQQQLATFTTTYTAAKSVTGSGGKAVTTPEAWTTTIDIPLNPELPNQAKTTTDEPRVDDVLLKMFSTVFPLLLSVL